jgi:hypothetical protein
MAAEELVQTFGTLTEHISSVVWHDSQGMNSSVCSSTYNKPGHTNYGE